MRNARPGEPHTVIRLDKPNPYYQIIPWETDDGLTVTTQVDARFGTFQSLHLQEKPRRETSLFMAAKDEKAARKAVLERVAYRKVELSPLKGQITLYPELGIVAPTLVWKPCQESFAPHLPFDQYVQGGNTVYVRIDGEIFTALRSPGRTRTDNGWAI